MKTWTFTREDGSQLVLDDDISGASESPFVVTGFSPYLAAEAGINDQKVVGGSIGAARA